jgi:hypothetical protein
MFRIELGRLGQFCFFIGLVLLVVFFATDQSQHPQVGFFFGGLILVISGIYLIRRDWKPQPPSNRFRLLRRRNKNKKEEPEDKKSEEESV